MNEREAREATLLEAFETVPAASPSWNDDDRRWADRVALEAVGGAAAVPVFVAERARHAMHRLLPRERVAARWLERPPRLGAWVVAVVVVAAVLGLLADPIGASQRINLLAPPFWGLMLWNVVVYALLIVGALVAAVRRRPAPPGPLRRAAAALLRVGQRMAAPTAGSATARAARVLLRAGRASAAPTDAARAAPVVPLARFATLWSGRSAPLAALRAQTFLHAGAAALAAGLIAGLYLRGLLLDYRVGWESTFLSAPTVQAWLTAALAPASALLGITLPDAAGFGALQTQPDGRSVGAPAAQWIHLLALTMGLVVIVPRVLLALGCAARTRWLGRRFALPWSEPYFQRLARLQRGAAAAVDVFPYAHTPTPQAALGLQTLVSEAFGPKASVRIAPTLVFGAEDDAAAPGAPAPGATHVVLLCDLAATPELETHGRCAAQLRERLPAGALFALLVDEAAFRRRFAGLAERLRQRRAAWSDLAARIGCRAAFADLGAPLDRDVVAAWHAAFAPAPADGAATRGVEPRGASAPPGPSSVSPSTEPPSASSPLGSSSAPPSTGPRSAPR